MQQSDLLAANGQLLFEGEVRQVHSPKRPTFETAGMADVFPYYAGFSFDWARQKLRVNAAGADLLVLDPWNGSGTTTLAAQSLGLASIGIDLNPVANVVARLRTQVRTNASPAKPPTYGRTPKQYGEDPLHAWFEDAAAYRLRQWANALLVMNRAESALGLVSLFRVVRQLTKGFEGSNPTWVLRTSDKLPRITVDRKELDRLIVADQAAVVEKLTRDDYETAPVSLVNASSSALPIASSSIDAIITSPPYLTRIDYAVAYSRELAILGIDIVKDRTLRAALMGTTLIRPSGPGVPYGRAASELLHAVSTHPSKASAGYYMKQARQYLDDLVLSIEEASRVARERAVAVIVVQDSYYKDVHVKLADICIDEFTMRGWAVESAEPFVVSRILTQMNPAAKAYSKGSVAEHVITLRKGI